MAALLLDVGEGDEIIMPSWTFVSTANAFVLRGATPVFVDIRSDTLNLDESLLDAALTGRTKAVVPVHYAGIACEMDEISEFARVNNLAVVEDAAQGFDALYKNRPLGTLSDLGALSFHVSKNVVSGEGGALIVSNPRHLERAHVIREKGTNRTAFTQRRVDRYEWLDVGSSYLPADIIAALLLSQLEYHNTILESRRSIWQRYHGSLAALEQQRRLRRPVVPAHSSHNAHIYYVLLPSEAAATRLREGLRSLGLPALSHYVPLHSAPAGRRFARTATGLSITEEVAATLVRLPLHGELKEADVDQIVRAVTEFA